MRSWGSLLVMLAAVAALRASVACDDSVPPCRADTDCPQGEICREQRCGPVGVDGGSAAPDANVSPSCALEGAVCALNEECCSFSCVGGRCAPDAPPPGSSGGSCRGLYEQCSTGSDECCDGLACTSGVCR